MTLDEVILELYRVAETKQWDGKNTDEALAVAIEGLEQILMLRQTEMMRNMKASASSAMRKQPRVCS